MTLNALKVQATGANSSAPFRGWSDWLADDYLDVKRDFGAKGDGSTDDGTALTNAINAAFGSPRNGLSAQLNKRLFLPPGNYATTKVLYLTNIYGGVIFGVGPQVTAITYIGADSGNTVAPSAGGANTITPVFMTNGFGYSVISGIKILPISTGVGIYVFDDGSVSTATTGDRFQDLTFENCTDGILVGYEQTQDCSECTYVNVGFSNCTGAGLRIAGGNALNHTVIGGGANNCGLTAGGGGFGDGSGAGYSCVQGSLGPLINVSLALNPNWDIFNNSACQIHVINTRTESVNFFKSIGSTAILTGCSGANSQNGTFIELGSNGMAILDGCATANASSVASGTSGSKIYIRAGSFAAGAYTSTGSGFLGSFTGTLGQGI